MIIMIGSIVVATFEIDTQAIGNKISTVSLELFPKNTILTFENPTSFKVSSDNIPIMKIHSLDM